MNYTSFSNIFKVTKRLVAWPEDSLLMNFISGPFDMQSAIFRGI